MNKCLIATGKNIWTNVWLPQVKRQDWEEHEQMFDCHR
jgi:hypothetical protein